MLSTAASHTARTARSTLPTTATTRATLTRCFASGRANSEKKPKRRNTFGSNEFRRTRHLRRVSAQQDALTLRQAAAIGATVRVAAPDSESGGGLTLVPPKVCLGCGSRFQSEFEHTPGFIDPAVFDKFMRQVEKQIRGSTDDTETASASASEEKESEHDVTASSSDGTGEVITSDSHNDSATAGFAFSSDAEWQDALRRGLITESELATHHHIEILTPAQVREEMKKYQKEKLRQRTARVSDSDSVSNSGSESASPIALETKPLRCARCYQLSHYGHTHGQVSSVIATDFRAMLKSRFLERGGKSSVVIVVVDLFDLHGSVIPDLSSLVGGRNPIILVANKRDLLPAGYGDNRVRAWLKAEAHRYGIHFHSVQLVSAKTGEGVPGLMRKAAELAASNASVGQRDIYVIGATNAGKSSLINKLIDMRYIATKGQFIKQQIYDEAVSSPVDGNVSDSASDSVRGSDVDSMLSEGRATASSFPGTTLGLVGFPLIPAREGSLYDTPGVIHNNQLASQLTFAELKSLMPSRSIVPVTYRLEAGQTLLLGGVARVDFIEGRPMFFTSFVSQLTTIHVTNTAKLDADNGAGMLSFYEKHVGELVSPPFSNDRFLLLGLAQSKRLLFDLDGQGWDKASDDLVLPGVGWVSVTGSGKARVRVMVAAGLKPQTREPLMPFEARKTSKRFHGSDRRATKSQRNKLQTRTSVAAPTPMPPQTMRSFTSLAHSGITGTPMMLALSRSFSTRSRTSSPAARRGSSTRLTDDELIDVPVLNSRNASVASALTGAVDNDGGSGVGMLLSSLPQPVHRPDWSVYQSMLASHKAMVAEEYRQTEDYHKRPKGPWRMRPSGEAIKLFKPAKKSRGGKFRKAINRKWAQKRVQQS